MATKATVVAAPAAFTPEQIAMLRAMLSPVAAPKETQAAKVQVVAAGVSGADSVVADLVAAGAAVIRTGKAGVTGSGKARVWVDVSIGGIRLSGNAYRNKA